MPPPGLTQPSRCSFGKAPLKVMFDAETTTMSTCENSPHSRSHIWPRKRTPKAFCVRQGGVRSLSLIDGSQFSPSGCLFKVAETDLMLIFAVGDGSKVALSIKRCLVQAKPPQSMVVVLLTSPELKSPAIEYRVSDRLERVSDAISGQNRLFRTTELVQGVISSLDSNGQRDQALASAIAELRARLNTGQKKWGLDKRDTDLTDDRQVQRNWTRFLPQMCFCNPARATT